MKNITITLDRKMADWLRLNAAAKGMSVSRFLGDLIHDRMREVREYNEAMRRFFEHQPVHLEWAGGRRPARDEVHQRAKAREDAAHQAPPAKEAP